MNSSLRTYLSFLFFISGFCSLLYQVVWIRLAFAHFGVITHVLSIILSVFMLGLALGSWWGPRWAKMFHERFHCSAIYLYALAEAGIGLGSLAVPWMMEWGERALLRQGSMDSLYYLLLSALAVTVSILPWCILMGTTFPFMMAYIREGKDADTQSFSCLYAANVLGAVLGTLAAACVFIELFGFKTTSAIAGVLNVSIAAGSLLALRGSRTNTLSTLSPRVENAAPRKSPLSPNGTRFILLTTGLISMSLEVAWIRAFTVIIGTTIYAFAYVLSAYLLATFLGSRFYRWHVSRGAVVPLGLLVGAAAASSFLPVCLNDPILFPKTPSVLISIFPLCAILGYLTPSLIDGFALGDPRRAGEIYSVNILGCILGPLAATYLLLPYMGVRYTMLLLSVPFIGLMAVYLRPIRSPLNAGVWLITLLLLGDAAWVRACYEDYFREGRFHAVVRRDHTATVISFGQGRSKQLKVNGVGITSLTSVTKTMAHLPLAFYPGKPRAALDICFGMGTTYRSLLRWKIRTTAVELVPSVRDAFGFYHADASSILADPNGRIIVDDGRRFLQRSSEIFDVITLDPPPPVEAAASSLLYSTQFYQLAKKRLSEHGILQQWFPFGERAILQAIARSLAKEFPYVKIYKSSEGWGYHFLASQTPLPDLTVDQLVQKIPPEARADWVEWETSKDVRAIAARILKSEIDVRRILAGSESFISDDHPYNEYYLLRRARAKAHHRYVQVY